MKKIFLFEAIIALSSAIAFSSCDDDPSPNPDTKTQGNYIVGVSTDAKSYLLTTSNIDGGKISVVGNGEEATGSTLHPYKGEKGFIFVYKKGDPASFQTSYFRDDKSLAVNKAKTMPTREECIGYYKNYMVAMTSITLENGQHGEAFNFIDGSTESIETSYISTENLINKGEYANMGGLITIGDNLISAVEPFRIPTPNNDNTVSENLDEINIVVFTKEGKDIKTKKIIKDDRASFAVGRRRSGRLSTIGTNGNGDIYVFSPANQRNAGTSANPKPENTTKHPSSVLRISKNTLEFDKSYYYDIESKSGGLKLQNAFSLFGDYFLLNMFATTKSWNMQTANKFAIFDVKSGNFMWITGLPTPEDIAGYNPLPYIEGESVYLPLTAAGKSRVYVINAKTARAVEGVEVEGDVTIGNISKLDFPSK